MKSQSADSLLNNDMDTAPPPTAPDNHTWMDGLEQRPKDMDTASSAHSNQHSPQTHEAFLSLLTNKGNKTLTVIPFFCFYPLKLNFIFHSLRFLVEEYSIGSATDLTETSSVVDGDWTMVDENSSTLSLSQAELEHISMELANKGPHKSQVQLRWDPTQSMVVCFNSMRNKHVYLSCVFCVSIRYLLHVFMEAGCLEWCVVIGLILRDANVIKQVISFLDNPEVPAENVQSVRNGLLAVDAWASTDWWVVLCWYRYF